MKALTLWQPWASLIADRRKTIETRTWPTAYRGELAIHAGSTVDRELCEYFDLDVGALPRGAVVAVASLLDCCRLSGTEAENAAALCGTAGLYGFFLAAVRPLDVPVPARGAQGLWELPRMVEESVLARLSRPRVRRL